MKRLGRFLLPLAALVVLTGFLSRRAGAAPTHMFEITLFGAVLMLLGTSAAATAAFGYVSSRLFRTEERRPDRPVRPDTTRRN